MNRLLTLGAVALSLSVPGVQSSPASQSGPATDSGPEHALPDIPTLMHEVELHQRLAETVEKDYIFREESTLNERKSDGGLKKTDQRTYEIFWINGVRLARLVRKDGKDLSPDELKKENDRLDKEVAKARERREKADADGKETDSNGREEITVSRILELGTFSNPRRQTVNGRSTILVDYAGNPNAKTRNQGEGAMKLLNGTIWVDEKDRTIEHAEGRFVSDFKVGGGLVANIRKDTSFKWTSVRINDEVWLPSTLDAQGQARFLLFFSLNGDAHVHAGEYRKFKATSTILPGIQAATPVDQLPAEPAPGTQH